MKHYGRKILSLLIIVIAVFSTVSCDLFKTTTQTTTATTAVDTTVVTTETSDTGTTITTTYYTHTTTTTYSGTTETTTTGTTTVTTTTTTSTTTVGTTTVTFDTTTTATSESTTTIPTTTTSVSTTTYVNEAYIMVNGPDKLTYIINEDLNLTGLQVAFYSSTGSTTILNPGEFQVATVDMSTYGQKMVAITYGAYTAYFTIQVNLPSYYASAMNLTGTALLNELRSIINTGFHGVTYGDARYILDETDRDPNNSSKLILVYLGTSVSGVWDDGVTWNREHVWPQSLLPDSASNGTVNTCSDLHNLKPSNPAENGSRGNKYFDNATTSSSYEPRDAVKGDIARILLYMVVMYDELTLVDRTPGYLEMAMFSVLLQWNDFDSVDSFEQNRNEVIYSYQANRNPFIDYPEFAELIWN